MVPKLLWRNVNIHNPEGVATVTATAARDMGDPICAAGFEDLLQELGVLDPSAHLLAEGERVTFTPGQFVFHEGGEADTLYLIHRGRVVLERHPPSGAVEVETF